MGSLNPQVVDLGAKVKLTWTPDLSGEGYAFYVDGSRVSRTFKADASSTTFNKPDSGTHRYGVQKMDTVDALEEASWPAAPVPAGLLRDEPPTGWQSFERVDLMGSSYRDIPDTKDVLVNIGDYEYEEGIAINGGRKVVFMGGHITAKGLSRAIGVGLAVWPRTVDSHYYIEGLRIKPKKINGVWQRTMNDGIALRGPKGKVTIQNCLIGPVAVKQGYTPDQAHADVLQMQAHFDGELRVHRLTGYTEYSGIMESAMLVRKQDWSHLNLVATGFSATDLDPLEVDLGNDAHTAFGIYYEGLQTTLPGLTLNEAYWAKDPQQGFAGFSPPELAQRFKAGRPAEGDFVTEADVALPYQSPGYA